MSFESTRWTSNKAGGTNRAPFALGAVPTALELLGAQWDALMGDPVRQKRLGMVVARQIGVLYNKFNEATPASDITALRAQYAVALGLLNKEKQALGIPVTELVVSSAPVSAGATSLATERVVGHTGLYTGLVGVAMLALIFGLARRDW